MISTIATAEEFREYREGWADLRADQRAMEEGSLAMLARLEANEEIAFPTPRAVPSIPEAPKGRAHPTHIVARAMPPPHRPRQNPLPLDEPATPTPAVATNEAQEIKKTIPPHRRGKPAAVNIEVPTPAPAEVKNSAQAVVAAPIKKTIPPHLRRTMVVVAQVPAPSAPSSTAPSATIPSETQTIQGVSEWW